jgi:hypothetical protein
MFDKDIVQGSKIAIILNDKSMQRVKYKETISLDKTAIFKAAKQRPVR